MGEAVPFDPPARAHLRRGTTAGGRATWLPAKRGLHAPAPSARLPPTTSSSSSSSSDCGQQDAIPSSRDSTAPSTTTTTTTTTFSMSVHVNISTTTKTTTAAAAKAEADVGSSQPTQSAFAWLSTPAAPSAAVAPMGSAPPLPIPPPPPPPPHPHQAQAPPAPTSGSAAGSSSGSYRKRKAGHSKKSGSRDKGSHERLAAVAATPTPPTSGGGGGGGNRASMKSPFEKLNTLKLLLDSGHLTEEEYQERKTQIINEMTGTSTERKKPSPRRVLQPLMKTVVPHGPPDFARFLKERAEKLSFDVDTLEWHSTHTRVKLDLVPFATGQLRNAYYLLEVGAPNNNHHNTAPGSPEAIDAGLLVAKFSIRQAEPSSYLSDVEMQAVCAHYAALYNEHEPPLKVYYARSWILKLRDRGDLVCSVEEYLPGAYVKYSNNNGFVGRETNYRLMVVDIQGVNDSYTDPQIHTADGRGFGAGNLGTYGMEKFLESHRCNESASKESPSEPLQPPSTDSAATVTPITNAILSKAVLSAIEQLDTKLAFDMMLLNEQLMAMDSENRALKDQEELQQLHAFSQQKRQLEDRLHELEDQLVRQATELDEAQRSLERQFLVERDRTKKEMLTRLQSTKEALVTRTQDQVNTTTKRTMMENDHVLDELAFQSQETEKLLARHRDMEAELHALRVKTKMLEENEVALAKKSHYYQRLVRQLQGPTTSIDGGGKASTSTCAQDDLVAQETRHLQLRMREKDAEIARLQTRIVALEATSKRSQDWLHVFQQEKQFVVAQQDEVIQFLIRALHDISTNMSATALEDEDKEGKLRGAVDGVTTLGELMVRVPTISLDELSTSENRIVLRLLLEKMKRIANKDYVESSTAG
ncbi:hypothetical protein P43SY_008751 [Pythium insidiosum]|uniref:Alpha-type protein kinase domain-containing protein n=1 Tax=Pythium insidiosum TaxID=114742 RepID=A0AAD5Q7V4_PYTIN|nr:hypothetical protein P43SY_008751 [Pythium insidiosum]